MKIDSGGGGDVPEEFGFECIDNFFRLLQKSGEGKA
jgi:hypothetical protein